MCDEMKEVVKLLMSPPSSVFSSVFCSFFHYGSVLLFFFYLDRRPLTSSLLLRELSCLVLSDSLLSSSLSYLSVITLPSTDLHSFISSIHSSIPSDQERHPVSLEVTVSTANVSSVPLDASLHCRERSDLSVLVRVRGDIIVL